MEPKQHISPFINQQIFNTQTIVPIDQYDIPFPYQPYQVQKIFMATVIQALDSKTNALLESPTGTGKTLCLLSSVLTWYAHQISKKPHQKFKIIYASRTHSQLRQVIKQLKNTCFRPKIITAASRDQSCINLQLQNCFGHQKQIQCRKRVKGQIVTCDYALIKKAVSKYLNTDMPILDLQELRELGQKQMFCPFLLSRSQDYISEVDLILMPYNYVMDRNVTGIYQKMLNDAVLIIDQAHNIQNVAMQGSSMTLGMNMLQLAYEEVAAVRKKALISGTYQIEDRQIDFALRFIRRVQSNMQIQIDMIKRQYNGQGRMFSWKQMIEFFIQVVQTANEQNLSKQIQMFASIGSKLMMEMNQEYLWQFDKTCGYFNLLRQIINEEGLRNFYRLCYKEEDQIAIFELWCIDPSVGFDRLKKLGVKNIVLASGTLSPLSSWESELKTNFDQKLSNKHVINSSQVMLNIVQSGPNQQKFVFSYNNRSNQKLNQDVCEAIVRLAQNIPNGVVVFFPSNVVMETIMKAMRFTNLLSKLMGIKNFHFEPRGDQNFQIMLKDFKKNAISKKGALLFAVCRSRVSEGIDLSDELCRAVLFIGVPYPPIKDMKIMEKKSYQDKLRNSQKDKKQDQKSFGTPIDGQEWYNQQTIRAVNQALGRAIRHKNDYGAIYLFDCRYNSTISLRKQLPKWALQTLKVSNNFQNLMQDTKTFFSSNKKLDEELRPSISNEDDSNINQISKKPRISLKRQVSQNMQINTLSTLSISMSLKKQKSEPLQINPRGSGTLHQYFAAKNPKL